MWNVLDRLESLEDDTRLQVLVDLAARAQEKGRPVLVVTDRVDEAEYVAGRLRATGLQVAVLSGSTEPSERQRGAAGLERGSVVVATRLIYDWMEPPGKTEQIWWTPPRTIPDALQRIARSAGGGRIIALVADPPLPDDGALLRLLDRVRDQVTIRLDDA